MYQLSANHGGAFKDLMFVLVCPKTSEVQTKPHKVSLRLFSKLVWLSEN